MVKSFDITIRVFLEEPVAAEVARDFVEEMHYEIKDTTGKVSIKNTEVFDDNIDDKDVEDYRDHKRGLYGES